MAKSLTSLLLLLLSFISLFYLGLSNAPTIPPQKTWCVAKPSTEEKVLLANMNYACAQVDCRILQKGSPCSLPDTLINHASVAMNLYYQFTGRNQWNCFFANSGLVVMTDPSYGSCIYN